MLKIPRRLPQQCPESMRFVAGLLFLSLFCSAGSTADELLVPGQYGSIAEAVRAANPGDTVLVQPGTYRGNLVIDKRLRLRSASGPAQTVLDGGSQGSVVVFLNARRDGLDVPELSGFTIRNGRSPEGQGGGITLYASDTLVENNTILGNQSSMDGGGILVDESSRATIRFNEIRSNTAHRFGGGIYVVNGSDPSIAFNTIAGNTATGAAVRNGGASGGGIYMDAGASPQVIDNRIEGNSADFAGGGLSLRVGVRALIEENDIVSNRASYGGGIHLETEGSAPAIRNNLIAENEARESLPLTGSGFGGGISVYNQTRPAIVGNTVSGNIATNGGGGIVCAEQSSSNIASNSIRLNRVERPGNGEGGGLYVASALATVTSNVIDSNESALGGGIALLDSGVADLENNTIVRNVTALTGKHSRPATGGGIFVNQLAGSVRIANNIITMNTDYQIFEEFQGARITHNLINDDGYGLYFNYDTLGITNTITLNASPLVEATGNVSGEEGFVDPLSGNFDIGAGSDAIGVAEGPLLSVFDRVLRVRDFNPDAGAFEYSSDGASASDIYRFWSDSYRHHFYTGSLEEALGVITTFPRTEWRYEGVPFRAYAVEDCRGDQVHRFWSDTFKSHFYTISDSEKDAIIATYPQDVWRYEGAAMCAFSSPGAGLVALHRFWSDLNKGHFYTASEEEKDFVIANYDDSEWLYEGVAFYVLSSN
jgi:parallel beta-helix repeat protein